MQNGCDGHEKSCAKGRNSLCWRMVRKKCPKFLSGIFSIWPRPFYWREDGPRYFGESVMVRMASVSLASNTMNRGEAAV